MRIVEFEGHAVKRQRQTTDDSGNLAILVTFYDRAPMIVSPTQWQNGVVNKYYDNPDVKRKDVVRRNASVCL